MMIMKKMRTTTTKMRNMITKMTMSIPMRND